MKKTLLAMALCGACSAFAARTTTRLAEGWRADGEPVTLPHTWNVEDGADGCAPAKRAELVEIGKRDSFSKLYHGWRLNPARSDVAYVRKEVIYTHALPDPKPGRRLFFKCDGAAVTAEVFVNGILVGRHLGAYTGFCYELTQQLKEKDNLLAVVVDSRLNRDIPTLSADFTVFGGIYRDCWLIETDPVCIDPTYYGGPGVAVRTDAETGAVTVDVRQNGGREPVSFAVDGRPVEGASFRLAGFERWTCEKPRVYRLTATLANGDAVTVPFGFRTVGFDAAGNFALNGQPLKLRGVNRHQEVMGKGWAVSREDEARDVRIMKEMGVNAVRTAHYPQSDNVYSLFDESGILAWCELPCTDTLSPTAAFRANVAEMIREMVAQLGNHPSVAMWSIFNELQNGWAANLPEPTVVDLLTEMRDLFKRLDPTRTVVAATCQRDAADYNRVPEELAINTYPGWYWGDAEFITNEVIRCGIENKFRKIGVSEYGSGANVNQHQWPARPVKATGQFHPEEYQAVHHATQYPTLAQMDSVWGTFVWVMFDFAADTRNEGSTPGINDKGLVTRDRQTKKDAYYFYQANWTDTPVLRLVGAKATKAETNRVPVLVFCNTGKVTLTVNGEKVGEKAPDAFRRVRWDDVALREGANEIVVESAGRRVAATWTVVEGGAMNESAGTGF